MYIFMYSHILLDSCNFYFFFTTTYFGFVELQREYQYTVQSQKKNQ